jgi:hypothetical protein
MRILLKRSRLSRAHSLPTAFVLVGLFMILSFLSSELELQQTVGKRGLMLQQQGKSTFLFGLSGHKRKVAAIVVLQLQCNLSTSTGEYMVRRSKRYSELPDKIGTSSIRYKTCPLRSSSIGQCLSINNHVAVSRRLAVCCYGHSGPADRKPPGLASVVR